MNLKKLDTKIIEWLRRSYLPIARAAIFVVYFYFGALKLLGESPASPLAQALTDQTIGGQYYEAAFMALAVYECVVGILFLLPKATRIVVLLMFIHLLIVSSPLVLISEMVWIKPFVPTLEGQYIIKNVLLIAVAIGIAAQTKPIDKSVKLRV